MLKWELEEEMLEELGEEELNDISELLELFDIELKLDVGKLLEQHGLLCEEDGEGKEELEDEELFDDKLQEQLYDSTLFDIEEHERQLEMRLDDIEVELQEDKQLLEILDKVSFDE